MVGGTSPFRVWGQRAWVSSHSREGGVLTASDQNEIQPALAEDRASTPLHLKFRSQGPSPHTPLPEDGRPPSGPEKIFYPVTNKQTNKNELIPRVLFPGSLGLVLLPPFLWSGPQSPVQASQPRGTCSRGRMEPGLPPPPAGEGRQRRE